MPSGLYLITSKWASRSSNSWALQACGGRRQKGNHLKTPQTGLRDKKSKQGIFHNISDIRVRKTEQKNLACSSSISMTYDVLKTKKVNC